MWAGLGLASSAFGGRDQFSPMHSRRTATPEAGLLHPRVALSIGILLTVLSGPATAQEGALSPDSARTQIRSVLRAFYLHLETRNWEALSPYVLSPKLLERRGAPGDIQMVPKDRARGRGSSHAASTPRQCPGKPAALVDEALIQLDGDWAEVSVPRCSGASAGVDELRMLYFEQRWRFIYTDLFDGSANDEQ